MGAEPVLDEDGVARRHGARRTLRRDLDDEKPGTRGLFVQAERNAGDLVQTPKGYAGSEACSGCNGGEIDAMLQGLDFLLRTAAEAFLTRAPAGADLLVNLTSDRAHAHKSIRNTYEAVGPESDDDTRNLHLELIDIYFRCVYLTGHVAKRLREDIAAPETQRIS